MTESEELEAITEQFMEDPYVLGRIVSRLRKNGSTAQKHKDLKSFDLYWRDTGKYWRCTIFLSNESDDALAQIDLHADGTVRTELYEPGSITVDPAENLLVVVRIKPRV